MILVHFFFLKKLENSYRRAFIQAYIALAYEQSVSSSCGTTTLIALILGRHLLAANAGDCRAIHCRKGAILEIFQDHRPSYFSEQRTMEELGSFINDEYLNGYLSITCPLGIWTFKFSLGLHPLLLLS